MRYRVVLISLAAAMLLQSAFAVVRIGSNHKDALYKCGEEAVFTVRVEDGAGNLSKTGSVDIVLDNFGTKVLKKRTCRLSESNPIIVEGSLQEPGFLRLKVTESACREKVWSVAFEPDKVRPVAEPPPDFDAFWAEARRRLAETVPLDPQICRLKDRSTEAFDFYRVSFATWGGTRLYGYLSVPTDKSRKAFPVRVNVPAAGCGPWMYDMDGACDEIRLQIGVHPYETPFDQKAVERLCREQDARLMSRYGTAYQAAGFGDARDEAFYYRVILGIDRVIDWVAVRGDVDADEITYDGTSQGGGLGIILTGLNKHIRRACFYVPAMTDTLAYRAYHESSWPKPVESQTAVERKLVAEKVVPYFDAACFATRIHCPVRFVIGLADGVCPPHGTWGTFNVIPAKDKMLFYGIGMGHGCRREFWTGLTLWQHGVKRMGSPLEVELTFDDNAKGMATVVAPELAKRNWHGTFNVVVDELDGPRLDWRDCRKILDMGHEVASHTLSHPDLVGLLAAGNTNEVRRQIVESRDRMTARLGQTPRRLCLPGNAINPIVASMIRAAGMQPVECARPNYGCETPPATEKGAYIDLLYAAACGKKRVSMMVHGVSAGNGWLAFDSHGQFFRHLDEIARLEKEGFVIVRPHLSTCSVGDRWVRMIPSRDVEAGSALDFSRLGNLDAPAGKYGFIMAKDSHFEFERRPGAVQRFYGANLCFDANFPQTEADADRLVSRLISTGYNAIRLHHHDGRLYRLNKDFQPKLDDGATSLLDRFLAKAFAAGIYVTTDLFVSRPVCWREIGIDREGAEGLDFKRMLFVHEGALENWKRAAREFLTHRNPHTGRKYAEEPALAFLCLVNENSMQQGIRGHASDPYFRAAWKRWLKAEREKDPKCWPLLTEEEIPAHGGGWSIAPVIKDEAWDAVGRFCADLERRLYVRMRDYLRKELGVKALLSDQNWGSQTCPMQEVRAKLFDYVDAHLYVDHPEFPNGGWHLPSVLKNENLLRREGCDFDISWRRVADKPFVVSEWNFCGPGRHRSMSGLYMGALAALQDWDALWRFSYSHGSTAYSDDCQPVGYFDAVNDPVALMAERLFVPLFLRGDLDPLEVAVATVITPESVRPHERNRAYNVLPRWYRHQWDLRVSTALPGRVPNGFKALPIERTAEDTCPPIAGRASPSVRFDPVRGTMSVATERTCALYATEGAFEAGVLSVTNTGGEATVWVTSLDGRPIKTGRRLLAIRLGDVQNDGTEFSDVSCRKVVKWGSGCCMEKGRSWISIERDGNCRVWLLDMRGRRRREVPASFSDGVLRFEADVAMDREEAGFAFELEAY